VIRAVVFDFDGTLVLSNAIKEDALYVVAAGFPGGRELMQRVAATKPGDRTAIWTRFSAEMGIPDRTDDLIAQYTTLCETRIKACPERAGASAALHALRTAGLRLYVNSSTPTEPLRSITAARFTGGTFDGVYGGHGCKLENVRHIARVGRLEPAHIVMVGDGTDDADAARAFDCHFIGVCDGTFDAARSAPAIDDLRELPTMITAIEESVR
jgi:phosphoglycolate phosphatase